MEEVETEVELVSTGAGEEEEVRCTCGSSLDEGFMIQVGGNGVAWVHDTGGGQWSGLGT